MHSIFLFGTPPKFVKSPSYISRLTHSLLGAASLATIAKEHEVVDHRLESHELREQAGNDVYYGLNNVKKEKEDKNNLIMFSFRIIETIYTQIHIAN